MKHFITFIILLVPFLLKAQIDTLFVKFEQIDQNRVTQTIFRHKNDSSTVYPFDGGRIYVIQKRVGKFNNDLTFSFLSYTPEWMDLQFYYQKVEKSILKKKDFKTREWFDKTSYNEIIEIFGSNPGDKIIMLLDETHLNDKQVYLVRVYFSFPAIE